MCKTIYTEYKLPTVSCESRLGFLVKKEKEKPTAARRTSCLRDASNEISRWFRKPHKSSPRDGNRDVKDDRERRAAAQGYVVQDGARARAHRSPAARERVAVVLP